MYISTLPCRVLLSALHFNENVGRKQAILPNGELSWRTEFPKAKRGEYVMRDRKVKMTYGEGILVRGIKYIYIHSFVGYVKRLQAAVEERIIKKKRRNMKRAPPPLCSTFVRPDKRQAIEDKLTRSRFNKT